MRPLILLLFTALSAFSDGGTVQLRQESGPFIVTVFSDLSIMIQQRTDLQPVLDAEVTLHLNDSEPVKATHDRAQNKLLYAAPVALGTRARQTYTIAIKNGTTQTSVSGVLDVAQRRTQFSSAWTYLAFPPLLITLFVVREWLVRRRAKDLN